MADAHEGGVKMKRTRWFTLRRIALGLAVAAIAPATAQAQPPDFWNYDPQTGEKIANSSPGVAPEELATLSSVSSGLSKTPDDRPFSRATNVTQTKPTDFWNYDPQTGEKIANTSPGVAPEELATLSSVSSGTKVAKTQSVSDNSGYDLRASILSGFAIALVLAGGALLAIRHGRRAKVLPA
jgi:hypothetical protein